MNRDILCSKHWFGNFGQIKTIKFNDTGAVFITFERAEDAQLAIQSMDGMYCHHKKLKITLGCNKYCKWFLKGSVCADIENGICTKYHTWMTDKDLILKSQLDDINNLYISHNEHQQLSPSQLTEIRFTAFDKIYITRLTDDLLSEHALHHLFKQFGTIQSIELNTQRAWIRYYEIKNCKNAFKLMNEDKQYEHLNIRYGTTRYCRYFVKGEMCFDVECTFLHKWSLKDIVKYDTYDTYYITYNKYQQKEEEEYHDQPEHHLINNKTTNYNNDDNNEIKIKKVVDKQPVDHVNDDKQLVDDVDHVDDDKNEKDLDAELEKEDKFVLMEVEHKKVINCNNALKEKNNLLELNVNKLLIEKTKNDEFQREFRLKYNNLVEDYDKLKIESDEQTNIIHKLQDQCNIIKMKNDELKKEIIHITTEHEQKCDNATMSSISTGDGALIDDIDLQHNITAKSKYKFEYWLTNIVRLPQYLPSFREHEYDDIALIEFFDQDIVLNELSVKKLHCKLILKKVNEFKLMTRNFNIILQRYNGLKPYQQKFSYHGILTLNDLQNDIRSINDIKYVLDIKDDIKAQKIWNVIQNSINSDSEGGAHQHHHHQTVL